MAKTLSLSPSGTAMLPPPDFSAKTTAKPARRVTLNPADAATGSMLPAPDFSTPAPKPAATASAPPPAAKPAASKPVATPATPAATPATTPAAIDPAKQVTMAQVNMSRAGRNAARAEKEYNRTTSGAIGAASGGTGLTPDAAWRKWFPTPGVKPDDEKNTSQTDRTAAIQGTMPRGQAIAAAPAAPAAAPAAAPSGIVPRTITAPNGGTASIGLATPPPVAALPPMRGRGDGTTHGMNPASMGAPAPATPQDTPPTMNPANSSLVAGGPTPTPAPQPPAPAPDPNQPVINKRKKMGVDPLPTSPA